MLDIILQILSILGIILLVVLSIAVILLLLVLFFPITYRLCGTKSEKDIFFSAKAKWLFGVLRVNYSYPKPGNIVAKLLWFKLFDSSEKTTEDTEETGQKNSHKGKKAASKAEKRAAVKAAKSAQKADRSADAKSETKTGEADAKVNAESDRQETNETVNTVAEKDNGEVKTENMLQQPQETSFQDAEEATWTEEPKNGIIEKFLQKIEKIKYTFHNICDKIKMIWENISYYSELLQEENTRELFSHACLRIGKILKNIRPRHLEARILAGTGSPDTTGYLYGVYGILLPTLGSKFLVTPDFERAVLEGGIKASGHITVAVLLLNALKLLLDKKLHLFFRKLKAAPGRETKQEKK